MSDKRENYLSWDEYFMMNALLISARSKDPHNRVGSCIVNSDNKVLSVGYNGLPRGMNDDTFDWASTGEITGIKKDVKDYYVVHAERNAILNYRGSLDDLKAWISAGCARTVRTKSALVSLYRMHKGNNSSRY